MKPSQAFLCYKICLTYCLFNEKMIILNMRCQMNFEKISR